MSPLAFGGQLGREDDKADLAASPFQGQGKTETIRALHLSHYLVVKEVLKRKGVQRSKLGVGNREV